MAKFRTRRTRVKSLPINRLIPNILTMAALCAGLTSLHFGLQARWEAAVWAIVVAAVLDGLDGRVARILKGTSKFGAELDSLSDFVSFGVAPALLLFLWSLQETGKSWGWLVALVFVVSCALRLARFNTALDKPDMPPWAYNFFTGVPAPAGAGLALVPMMLSFEFALDVLSHPLVVTANMLVVAALMVSRIPTFSFKRFAVPHDYVLPTLLGVGVLAALLVAAPWATMSAVGILYVSSFALSWRSFRFLQRRADELQRQVRGGEEGTDEVSATPDTPTDTPEETEN